MTTTAPALYRAKAYTETPAALAVAVLNTTHAAVAAALAGLRLCPLVGTWPELHVTESVQLRDRALREHAYATRDHQPSDDHCTCQPSDIHAAATLAGEWLHLWKLALAHIQHPDVHDAGLVRRAARLVTDYAAYLATGNLDHLVAAPAPDASPSDPAPPSPWFQPPRFG